MAKSSTRRRARKTNAQQQRPAAKTIWQRSLLSQAIVIAGASLPGAVYAGCNVMTGTRTTTCVVADGESATIASTGSIVLTDGAPAINVLAGTHSAGAFIPATAPLGTTITNDGTVSSSNSDGRAVAIDYDDDLVGSLNNNTSGTIMATASGGSSESAVSAYGIRIDNDLAATGVLINDGTVTATATADTYDASATGIRVRDDLEGTLTNNGSITAMATGVSDGEGTGIRVSDNLRGSLVNNGSITARGSTPDADADAEGIHVGRFESGSLTNTAAGMIDASASGRTDVEVTGIHIGNGLGVEAVLTNEGSISAESITTGVNDSGDPGEAFGILINGAISDFEGQFGRASLGGMLDNSGTISATASGTASLTAAAIAISDSESFSSIGLSGTLNNSGTLSASVTGTSEIEATGVFLEGSIGESGMLTNTVDGTFTVTATGTSDVYAAGILVEGGGFTESFGGRTALSGMLENSGTIDVTATGTSDVIAAGILIGVGGDFEGSSIGEGGSLTNTATGDISANATADTGGIAVGIGVFRIEEGGSLVNAGSVSAHVSSAGTSESSAFAAGILIGSLAQGGMFSNSGTVSATHTGVGANHWSIELFGNGQTIENSGNIIGQMNFESASLNNTGRVTMPVGDVGMIDGDYTQSGSGVLEIGVLSSAPGGYGQLIVTGIADISANDLLAVDVSANDMLVDDEIIEDVLSAGTLIEGGNMTVSDNSALWDFEALNDGMHHVDLVVDRAILIEEAVIEFGPLYAQPAAQQLDFIIDTVPNNDFIGALSTVREVQGLANFAAQTVPLLVAQSAKAANLSVSDASKAIISRIMDIRGLGAGDAGADKHLWLRAFGTNAEQDDERDATGFEIENYGVIMGYDNQINADWTLGFAFGYNEPEVNSDTAIIDHDIDIDGYQLAVYADWSADDMFVDLIGIYGVNDNDSERRISFGGVTRIAKGNFDSNYAQLYAAVGTSYAVSDNGTFSPVLSLGYTYVDEDSYTEKGAGDLNLQVRSNDADSLVLGIDGRFAFEFGESGSQFTTHLGVGFDVLTDESTLIANFVGGGSPFQTTSAEPDEIVYGVGVGLTLNATEGLQVLLNYEYEAREDFDNQMFNATLRWKF